MPLNNHKNWETIIRQINCSSIYVLEQSIPKTAYARLDLSVDNFELESIDTASSYALESYINKTRINKNATVLYGGYLETAPFINAVIILSPMPTQTANAPFTLGWICGRMQVQTCLLRWMERCIALRIIRILEIMVQPLF